MARSNLFEAAIGMVAVNYLFNSTGNGTGGGPLSGIAGAFDDITGRGQRNYPSKARRLKAQGVRVNTPPPRIVETVNRSQSIDEFDDIPGYNPYR